MLNRLALRAAAAALLAAAAPPTPADRYGPLYRAVELGRVFPDSKVFADAVPKRSLATILADYRARPRAGVALRRFVFANFVLPTTPQPPPRSASLPPLLLHIRATWAALARPAVTAGDGGSALALPHPFVVPGGRFRELYYWDSYFTMLGLARDGRRDLVEAMVDDFTVLIERYGHVPNGARSYYLSRSQPPVFFLMVALGRHGAANHRRLAAMRAEHRWWMRGEAGLRPGTAAEHVARLPEGSLLNRYWDARATPRDESFAEDVATARASDRPSPALWRELRAGAESGWDYSSRWLADGHTLASIRTTAIAPVDLNSLMVGLERAIADGCARVADRPCARIYRARAVARTQAIRRWMWDPASGAFADVLWRSGRPTGVLSAAAAFPLYSGIATRHQTHVTAATIRARLLAPGGLRTSLSRTGQQWDAPNGWAPLQWIAAEGLRRGGEPALARAIATRWIATVDTGYRVTGQIAEKYDVERHAGAGGGEYPNQIGFGWTNGVTRAFIARYRRPKTPLSAR